MRVRNLQELSALPMQDSFKRQLEAELKASPTSGPRPKANVTAIAGAKAQGTSQSPGHELQNQLLQLVLADDELRQHSWICDYAQAVPHRKFEVDLSIPKWCIGIELDGWLWHGKRKQDFLRDREKDYLLSMAGWQVYRIEAGLVYKDKSEAIRRIRMFLSTWLPRQRSLIELGHIQPPAGNDERG